MPGPVNSNSGIIATKWINFIMGVLPGWWLGAPDGRSPEPYIDSKRWADELQKAGFSNISTVYDGYLNNNIICMPTPASPRPKRITLLTLEEKPTPAGVQELEDGLIATGYEVERYMFGSERPVPPNQDIVSVLDFYGPFVTTLNEQKFSTLQSLFKEVKEGECGILWVTCACFQVGRTDPRYSPIVGLGRVLQSEMQLDFSFLGLENLEDGGILRTVVPKVLVEFQSRIVEEDVVPELEWACVDGKTLIQRYHFIKVGEELKVVGGVDRPIRKLEQHKPGLANTMFWKPLPVPSLGADEVRLAVKAVGINFKVGEDITYVCLRLKDNQS
jgi:hypothetical protein